MAGMTFTPRQKPKKRQVPYGSSELGAAARDSSWQAYTKPGAPSTPGGYDDLPMGKLIRFGGRVARKVIRGVRRLTGY